jgi:uncharacterized protein YdhG (YjbR/CyaY superfamily)
MTPAKKTASAAKAAGFTAEERAAMKNRVAELKAEQRGAKKADGEEDVLARIAEMPAQDRLMAQRLHNLIKSAAPHLTPKTWYGMPAYAKDGNVICFFQNSQKFKTRYSTLGFSDKAKLDEGSLWPNSYALMELTPDTEKAIIALVKKAVS